MFCKIAFKEWIFALIRFIGVFFSVQSLQKAPLVWQMDLFDFECCVPHLQTKTIVCLVCDTSVALSRSIDSVKEGAFLTESIILLWRL